MESQKLLKCCCCDYWELFTDDQKTGWCYLHNTWKIVTVHVRKVISMLIEFVDIKPIEQKNKDPYAKAIIYYNTPGIFYTSNDRYCREYFTSRTQSPWYYPWEAVATDMSTSV